MVVLKAALAGVGQRVVCSAMEAGMARVEATVAAVAKEAVATVVRMGVVRMATVHNTGLRTAAKRHSCSRRSIRWLAAAAAR